ncbi:MULTISPECIES: hypothetical protein [unclassified Ruegeria]|uniref:hypothetical protein n=1 Tax=unclassified Ruegeria TaxID=2625375 RepID=UPI001ADCE60F|nr:MULTISPECIES: hypothetical protein [unclassified Ruegeria]MBO9410508.1 hypothetical protein [Ruegeria sp. R8_1]MBO9414273.1 hypothetical protein [Ruegeria sp. R8_2]
MKGLVLILSLFAVPAMADYVGPDGKVRDCYCTDKSGARVDLGQMICLQVDGRMFMAQCQMSLNVPMWREVSEGCLSSELERGKPPINTVSVYPKI